MNIKSFRAQVESLSTHVLFEYNGQNCGVDPFNCKHFDIWCGENFAEAKSIDEVFELPIFDGKSLTDIYEKITNIEY